MNPISHCECCGWQCDIVIGGEHLCFGCANGRSEDPADQASETGGYADDSDVGV